MHECRKRLILLLFVASCRDFDSRVTGVRADVDFSDIHVEQPRVVKLKSNDLGELLTHCLTDS